MVNKLQCCRTTKYYSALKRNEVLILTTTKMNLKSIVLSKGNQIEKATYCDSIQMVTPSIGKCRKTETYW